MHPKEERTFVLIKPDGVLRGLIGVIITRFEKRGLKIIALKMVWASNNHVEKHYPLSDEWYESVGRRASAFFKEKGLDPRKYYGTDDFIEIGKIVKGWTKKYITQSPVVAMIIQGMHAISTVRKIVGHTYPIEAQPGTIRGDFSIDTPSAANTENRVVKNIIHASGNQTEAAHEISHWFKPDEIFSYKRAEEDIMF